MFRSIADQGGLRKFLDKQGIDYDYFVEINDSDIADTAMAKVLSRRYPAVKFTAWKMKHWKKVLEQERKDV